MEVQLELFVSFTQRGAMEFLKKIRVKIPQFYQDNGEDFVESTEAKEWGYIDGFLYDKKIKTVRKLLYNEIYLYQENENTHSGEVEFDELVGIIGYFFKDEKENLHEAKDKAQKSNENQTEIAFGEYGFFIKKVKIRRGRPTEKSKLKNVESKSIIEYFSFTKLPEEATKAMWSLYSFWEENELNNQKETTGGKKYRILQSLVKFEEDKITLHYTNKFEIIEEFSGEIHAFDYHGQTYFETNLMPLSDDRKVRIMFLFGEKMADLAMSIFYNIRSEGALFSGSGLLVKETETSKILIENSKCILHQRVDNQTISHFFERRSQNYLKLPRITDYNLDGLQKKIEMLLEKDVPKDIRIYKHDFFISIPMAYISDSDIEFNQNKKFCHGTIDILKESFGFTKNYFACEKYNYETYETMMRGIHYEDAMEGIAESKLFVLVIPKMEFPSLDSELSAVRFSSVWAELGYAIGLKKPILIVCGGNFESKLPNIVRSLNKQILVVTPNMQDIKTMKRWFKTPLNIMYIKKFLREKFIS